MERRHYLRAGTRLTTSYRLAGAQRPRRALVRDISAGGVCLITESPLAPGEAVEVTVRLPGEASPIAFTGQVIWSRPAGGVPLGAKDPTSANGIAFAQIEPAARAALVRYATLESPGNERMDDDG
jgi:c-di-GMP-binding flagellar brake protein YcgR